MKKIIVGRGLDCDIVIPDERDNVSRHHLVISFNLLGKMTISDTSSNGTFINEKKMLKGTSIPVTRNDKIRLGDRWDLDWSLVKDPYAAMRRQLLAAVALLIVAVAAVTWYVWKSSTGRDGTQRICRAQRWGVEQGLYQQSGSDRSLHTRRHKGEQGVRTINIRQEKP